MSEPVLEPGQETLLDLRLDALRGELATLSPPAGVEAALATSFRKVRPIDRPGLWWMPPLALAATIALVAWMIRGPVPANQDLLALAPSADNDPPFLALQPLDRIAQARGATVRTSEFPRALLADWGLPVSPERAGESVRAQTLYSADGVPLAVRLLN